MNSTRATALIIKENSVLMIQRFKNGEHYFVLPGGAVEKNESVEQATLRELLEETTIVAKVKEKVLEFYGKDERVHQVFLCEYVSGEPKLNENGPEFGWTTKDNTYLPRWVGAEEIGGITIYPEEERDLIKDHLK